MRKLADAGHENGRPRFRDGGPATLDTGGTQFGLTAASSSARVVRVVAVGLSA